MCFYHWIKVHSSVRNRFKGRRTFIREAEAEKYLRKQKQKQLNLHHTSSFKEILAASNSYLCFLQQLFQLVAVKHSVVGDVLSYGFCGELIRGFESAVNWSQPGDRGDVSGFVLNKKNYISLLV